MTTHPPPLPEVERYTVKPNYVRPDDIHSYSENCIEARKPCVPVIALADYEAAVSAVRLLRSNVRHSIDCEYERDKHHRRIAQEQSQGKFNTRNDSAPCFCGASQALADTEKWGKP